MASADNTLILYSNLTTPNEFKRNLHIPDVKKLQRVLDFIQADVISLKVNTNNLEYVSKENKFKFHLFEDGFLTDPPIKAEKILGFETDFSFTLTKEDYHKMVKASTFTTETNKIYFYMEDGDLKVDLTDRAKSNTDSYTLKVGVDIQGELSKQYPINFDNFKLINNFTDNVKVSINSKFGVFLFDIESEGIKCRYIITSLTQ